MSKARIEAAARRIKTLTPSPSAALPAVEDPPNIIEFATDERFLGRPLYPRQATLLKIVFLAVELMTAYDHRVISEWTASFETTGNHGVSPDLLRRMDICRSQGRRWFREAILAIGRRGGKGYLAAIALSYIVWCFLMLGGPQEHYGIAPDKRISLIVFGAKREQARDNLWRDVVTMITTAPCFEPYIAHRTADTLLLYTPADLAKINSGVLERAPSSASIEICARESTATAGRGPASFALAFDEFAHLVATGTSRSADEVWTSSTPSLDQFAKDAFIIEPSSTWTQTGQYYRNYCQAIEADEHGEPVYPSKVMVQLASWDPYEDWEVAHTLEMTPAGQPFPRFKRAIQTYDDEMRKLQQSNPETFLVERMSHFRSTLTPYLDPARVADMFGPYNGEPLTMQTAGRLNVAYKMHGDPALTQANFAVAIAHCETDDAGTRHVVFDYLGYWRPHDFPDNNFHIDYDFVGRELTRLWDAFVPVEFTLDQWNSAGHLQLLQRHARESGRRPSTSVFERTSNRQLNWDRAEVFKAALYQGRVHAPAFGLAELELRFLEDLGGKVDHPYSGPVQTKDLADCMFECVNYFLSDNNTAEIANALSSFPLQAVGPASPARGVQHPIHEALAAFGRRDRKPDFPHRHRGRWT